MYCSQMQFFLTKQKRFGRTVQGNYNHRQTWIQLITLHSMHIPYALKILVYQWNGVQNSFQALSAQFIQQSPIIPSISFSVTDHKTAFHLLPLQFLSYPQTTSKHTSNTIFVIHTLMKNLYTTNFIHIIHKKLFFSL